MIEESAMLLNFGQPLNGVIQMGYIVEDIHKSMLEWSEKLKIGPWFLREHGVFPSQFYRGEPTDVELSIAMGFAGHMMFELIQQHNDVPSVYQDVVRGRGFGFHHYGFGTDQYDEAIKVYRNRGYALVYEAVPVPGVSVAYFDTRADLPGMVEVIKITPMMEAVFTAMQQASVGWDGSNPVRPRTAAVPGALVVPVTVVR
jgi:hypothetical protein